MLHALAGAVAKKFLKYGHIREQDYEIHVYGWEGIFSVVLTYASILLVGLAGRRFWEAVLWLCAYMLLRSYAGGYHATSHGRCLLLSNVIWLACMLLIPHIGPITAGIMLAASCVIVYICAPAQHPDNPHSAGRVRQLRVIARILAPVMALLVIPCWLLWPAGGSVLTLAIFSCCVSTLAAYIRYPQDIQE